MTDNNHPITPPPELLKRWREEAPRLRDCGVTREEWIATQAARWGADQELEACCEWLDDYLLAPKGAQLRDARRPKPPSLKEQALEALRSMQIEPVILDGINVNKEVIDKYDIIRCALETLSD